MDDLKPCPFCGGEARMTPETGYGAALVFCPDNNNCGVHPSADADFSLGESLSDAVRRWNIRAGDHA